MSQSQLDTLQDDQPTKICVIYCAQDQIYTRYVVYRENLTAWQAFEESGLIDYFDPSLPVHMGIFSLKVDDPKNYRLQPQDRLEIYRPLNMNPKEVRRKRAERHPVGRFARGNQWRKQQKKAD